MPYAVPTLEQFRARFPVFEDSEDPLIETLLAEAGTKVDQSWEEADYQPAIMYLAAHLLATDNSAEGDLVTIGSAGDGAVASESFGGMSVSYAASPFGDGSLSSNDQYGTTEYGRRYLALLNLNRGGPLVV